MKGEPKHLSPEAICLIEQAAKIDRLQVRVEELEAENKELRNDPNLAPHQKMNLLWLSRAESAEARVAELENALKPFADFSERFPAYFADDHHPLQSVTSPTVKDYRKACAAFTAKLKAK